MKIGRKKPVPEPVRRRSSIADDASAFQRSRTLTGSASSKVRAGAEDRGELKSERIREHELRQRRKKIGWLFFGFLVLILAGLALISQFVGSFSGVTFTNNNIAQKPNAQIYEQIATDYFAKKPLERFTFAFRQDAFDAYMKTAAPEVKNATIDAAPFTGGKIKVTLREPVAFWEVNNERDYVDDEGVIFAQNSFAEPSVAIRDESGATVDGSAITSRRFLKFVGQVISGVASSGVGNVESVTIPSGAVRYVEFRLAGRPYPFKAQIDRDATSQTSDIINMAKFLDQRGITPGYVDVRVEAKGYYK